MRILLFGKDGQLGCELERSLATLGEVVALHVGNSDLCGDLRDLAGVRDTVLTVRLAFQFSLAIDIQWISLIRLLPRKTTVAIKNIVG